MNYRIGYGEDAHKLEPGRPLVLGNLLVDSPRGAQAHSDGDALLHALADALLAAFALGDIGDLFPPSDPQFENMDSARILSEVWRRVRAQGASLVNVAAVVTLDAPKLGARRQAMQARVAELLGADAEKVAIGFKTSEGLASDHVQARATVLLSCP